MTGPTYLTKRGSIWYVQVPVPRSRQQAVGAKTLERSLRTRDEARAMRERHAVIAEFQARIDGTAEALANDGPEALLQLGQDLRKEVEAGTLHPVDAEGTMEASLDRYLSKEAKASGSKGARPERIPDAAASTIRRAHKALSGSLRATLAFQREAYLTESKRRLTAQTIADKRRRLEEFGAWIGDDHECSEVTRRKAGQYVSEVVLARTQKDGSGKSPLSPTTLKKEISDLRAFFDWLMIRGVIESNPFDRMAGTVKGSIRGRAPARRAWLPEELSKVLHGVSADDPMWSLVVIGAFTGMRREEIGELQVSSVDGDGLLVHEGKRQSSVRRVPIHPALQPLIQRLAETTTDGFLIPGLLRGGPDKKRSWYLGKRFSYTIRRIGIADEKLDFHAFRHTVITQLEGAGVPWSTVQLIVGHRRQGVTLNYSGGVPDKVKRDALLHVSYGAQLDKYVSDEGARVTVKASAKPRKIR